MKFVKLGNKFLKLGNKFITKSSSTPSETLDGYWADFDIMYAWHIDTTAGKAYRIALTTSEAPYKGTLSQELPFSAGGMVIYSLVFNDDYTKMEIWSPVPRVEETITLQEDGTLHDVLTDTPDNPKICTRVDSIEITE